MLRCAADKNQPEIVKALRDHGAIVKHVHIVKKLFDIIVYYNGKTFSMEIKNGLKAKLSEGEKQCKRDIESVGVTYHVVYTIKQALQIINC